MSMDFVLLVCTFSLQTASDIELSVCSDVGGCLCPSSSRIIRMYTASLAMMYNAASSASVADVMFQKIGRISAIASQSSQPTENTMQQTQQLLDYLATQEEAVITYNASNMKLATVAV